ncbi:response regulator [Ectobacillus funiculus]|uniref:response regulator transcription factor n=1 Tax=Ectobacillus funiculus TaxID=137993 RepID=UPI00397AB13B
MYQLLIADDEPLEREGLELMVQRAMPEQFTIYHAENGRVAIEKADKHQPDIIFMDIKMPGIQGLEAVSVIQKKLPDTKIVIVTAYDYFTYAKEALSLGVSDYLLKPAKREQIVALLQRLTNEIVTDRSKRTQELELIEQVSHLRPLTENECTLMLMLETVQELDVLTLSRMLAIEMQFGSAVVISFPDVKDEKEQRRVYECAKHYVKSQQNCLVSPVIQQHMAVFFPVVLERERDVQQAAFLHDAGKLREYIKQQTGQTVCIGIGSVHKGATGWRQSYEEALAASKQCTEAVPVQPFRKEMKRSISEEQGRQLCNAISIMDEQAAMLQLRTIYEKLIEITKSDAKRIRAELLSLFGYISQFMQHSHLQLEPISFPDIDDLSMLRVASEQYVINIISKMKNEREKRAGHLLMLAKNYIKDKYTEDISLEQVAEHVNLNSVYFSKLFKKQTGETFSDYVMNMRIEKAKQLMRNEALSLKEICFQIGYHDPNYFSRVFKKCTNEAPKEYRQKLLL